MIQKLLYWLISIISTFKVYINAESFCSLPQGIYNRESCEMHWKCTIEDLLKFWLEKNGAIDRMRLSEINLEYVSHTPMWLRIHEGKLYCVKHPSLPQREHLRLKPYRARHYVNRLNRILKSNVEKIPHGTEWWTHHSDIIKNPLENDSVPIFGVAGSKEYAQIAGIPFMSFSDAVSSREYEAFRELQNFGQSWSKRSETAFFHGALSDCKSAKANFHGDSNYCVRAKLILEASRSKNPLLKNIKATSNFHSVGLNINCSECSEDKLSGKEFVKRLLSHKYLLNLPGAGPWSRRMSVLLRAGGGIFQSESVGYQFYELKLVPGVHYIPFDPEIGRLGAGNLISRLKWAKENDEIIRQIAARAKSFGNVCLSEQSIDYFVATLLTEYSKLLFGNSSSFPLTDLSTCIIKDPRDKITRICKGIIERCWE